VDSSQAQDIFLDVYSEVFDPLWITLAKCKKLRLYYGVFSLTFTSELDAMCAGYDPVKYRIRYGWLIKILIPFVDR